MREKKEKSHRKVNTGWRETECIRVSVKLLGQDKLTSDLEKVDSSLSQSQILQYPFFTDCAQI